MVTDPQIALRALHEALVAARNLGLESQDAAAVLDIIDTVERVPLWIADPAHDRTDDLIQLFGELAAEHESCRLAASTAARLR
jgi:hypothetical protein